MYELELGNGSVAQSLDFGEPRNRRGNHFCERAERRDQRFGEQLEIATRLGAEKHRLQQFIVRKRVGSGFAKAIAQTRSMVNPLKVNPDPAAAPKRYRMQMAGLFGHLRHGEGIYYPIRGWRSGGLDYYYVAYEFTYPDGRFESGNVPWPIHFAPSGDPFVSADVGRLQRTPLPPPPPGFVPPGDLGKALRYYFPNMQFEEADN